MTFRIHQELVKLKETLKRKKDPSLAPNIRKLEAIINTMTEYLIDQEFELEQIMPKLSFDESRAVASTHWMLGGTGSFKSYSKPSADQQIDDQVKESLINIFQTMINTLNKEEKI